MINQDKKQTLDKKILKMKTSKYVYDWNIRQSRRNDSVILLEKLVTWKKNLSFNLKTLDNPTLKNQTSVAFTSLKLQKKKQEAQLKLEPPGWYF